MATGPFLRGALPVQHFKRLLGQFHRAPVGIGEAIGASQVDFGQEAYQRNPFHRVGLPRVEGEHLFQGLDGAARVLHGVSFDAPRESISEHQFYPRPPFRARFPGPHPLGFAQMLERELYVVPRLPRSAPEIAVGE
ncbi:MAG: hypothetical protein H0W11_00845 [Gemmatimonadetes bacterium]|jgi:hypothetical protein|nr:hypothetical protein [Gemmatimonadota bacterium]MBA4158086.1 hypothetical protein [Gemmatimonadota bacterium]